MFMLALLPFLLAVVWCAASDEIPSVALTYRLCCPMYNASNKLLQYDYYSHLKKVSTHDKSARDAKYVDDAGSIEDILPENYTYMEIHDHALVTIMVSTRNPMLRCLHYDADGKLCAPPRLSRDTVDGRTYHERTVQEYMFRFALFGAMDLNYCAENCSSGSPTIDVLLGVALAASLVLIAVGLALWWIKRCCDGILNNE